ncbi:MAG: c-type cytochrome [Leptolyngbyaceae cyanobacterium SL_7_1]|nr:c-type cytochrome [Leptolyngbyaceae cyanobacterium SL_7_1]
MQSMFQNRQVTRWILLAALLLLSALSAILLQQAQSLRPAPPALSTPVETSYSTEPILPIPLEIPLDNNKVALGERLFQDTRLSSNNQTSCYSCHNLAAGGADRRRHLRTGQQDYGMTNTLTVFNASFNYKIGWDGRFASVLDHLDDPVNNPSALGSTWEEIVARLAQVPEYKQSFRQMYPDGLNVTTLKDALTVYQESLYTPNSRFDQFLRGNKAALTATEQAGYDLFKSYGCVSCHQGVNVGGNLFQRFGVMGDYFADRGDITPADLGRFNATQDEADRHVFRVPSLRNVALTAPYFHDGSAQTLEQAITIMGTYQLGRSLSETEVDQIAQFLRSLTGEYQGKSLEE